jgi:hypothetical protein
MPPPAPVTRPDGVRTSLRALLACLGVIAACSFLSSRIQSDWGRVQVTGVVFPTQNGQWLAADLFRPRTATAEKPAPLVVVVPGFQRSKETQANVAIELARRGMVVVSIDPYAQGMSSSSQSVRAATTEGYGMFAVVDYAAETGILNYVDRTRIAATGHSAGGNAAIQGASHFGREAAETGRPSKLHSVFVSGYVLTLTDRVLRPVRSNVGASYALYDEGAYRNELKNGDMRRAPEALRLVRSGLGKAGAALEEIEPGRYYGDAAERTLRVMHNEPLLHPFQPYSFDAMENQVAFFLKVFGLETALGPEDQVWHWRELLNLVSLVAAFVSLVPFARLLLGLVPWFGEIVKPLPPPQPRPAGRGRVIYWSLVVTGALIACFSYIPMTELSQKLFVAASGREQTWFFPQRMNNGVMLWAAFNGLVGFAIFFLAYRFHGRKAGANPETWGTAVTSGELLRTAVLAVLVATFFFGVLAVVYAVFHVDYRFLFLGARVFQPVILVLALMYVPVFFLFFLANSLRVNGGMRWAGDPEWRSRLVAGLANALGLFFILVMQYATFALTGTVHWTDGWLYINLLFAVVPIMFVLPYYNRIFFRMTGRIYLGPLATCLIFVLILLSNTVCYLPI